MKCRFYGCNKQTVGNFPACDSSHGYEYKVAVQQIKKCQDGIGSWIEHMIGLRNYEIGEIIHYSQYV